VHTVNMKADAIRTRHLLGHLNCNHTARLRQILCSTIRRKFPGAERMLRLDRFDRSLVHLVTRGMDKHVPSAGQMRTAKQKVLHHHRVATRLFQRHYSLRTTAYCRCSAALPEEKGLVVSPFSPWMLVSALVKMACVYR
jgi:hypothetical protein